MEKMNPVQQPLGKSQPTKVEVQFRGDALCYINGTYEVVQPDDTTFPTTHRAVDANTLNMLLGFLLDLRGTPARPRAEEMMRALCEKIKIDQPRIILPS